MIPTDITELSNPQLSLLCQLLSQKPGSSQAPTWARDQSNLISRLPHSLLRPSSLFSTISLSLSQIPKAQLCATHNPLNPYLIRDLFLLVTAEVTTRVSRLEEEHERLPIELRELVGRIQMINGFWMASSLDGSMFPRAEMGIGGCERVENGCEACILSRIGGDANILADLRASVLGRKKKRGPDGRLLKVLGAWIDWSGKAEEIKRDSELLGRRVRGVRKQMRAERQRKKSVEEGRSLENSKNDQTPLVDLSTSNPIIEDEYGDAGFESDIIDEYMNRYSRAKTPVHESDIHPAFRDSIVFDSKLGIFTRKSRFDRTHNHAAGRESYSSLYGESAYNTSTSEFSQSQTTAEARAEAYRNLAGISEAEHDLRGRNARAARRSGW